MKITKALFAGSSTSETGWPKQKLPEFAFIGRSNVGKSSLINMLCMGAEKGPGVRELAKTSASPGKTVLVNHFLINGSWYLVDLPGYGFAKLPKEQRKTLEQLINVYIRKSGSLFCLFVLLDSRHVLQKIDLDFLLNLGDAGIPFSLVFTKADKNGSAKLEKTIGEVKDELLKYWEELPPVFVSSSSDGRGRSEIISYIGDILKNNKPQKQKQNHGASY